MRKVFFRWTVILSVLTAVLIFQAAQAEGIPIS